MYGKCQRKNASGCKHSGPLTKRWSRHGLPWEADTGGRHVPAGLRGLQQEATYLQLWVLRCQRSVRSDS